MHINDMPFWGVFPGGQAFFKPFGANINVYTGATIRPNFFVLSFLLFFFIFSSWYSLRILLFFLISTYSSLHTLLFISLLILLVLYSSSSYSSILIFKLLVFSYNSSLLLNFYIFVSSSSSLLMPHPKWATRHLKRYNVPRPSQLRCSFRWKIHVYRENPAKIPVWQKIRQSIAQLV